MGWQLDGMEVSERARHLRLKRARENKEKYDKEKKVMELKSALMRKQHMEEQAKARGE